jgi:cellulose synthase/poly-beta-1,6-N-acetylglucosamine synthase-like glycosyltransferase/peptidoglycan/xylan/chitin deacetylase (PgdA/CDA1 family)
VTQHRVNRQPKAHWFLLALAMTVLLAELALFGFAHRVGAEGTGPATATGGPAAAAVIEGGPVLRIDGSGSVTTRGMAPNTVSLTFDDGPDPQWTPEILAVLKRHHAHATFFVIGSKVDEYPELARQIVADGNELGVHTFTHTDLAELSPWRVRLELTLTQNAIAAATGQTAALMRPPYASTPAAVTTRQFASMAQVGQDGYLVVLADHDTRDWARPGTKSIVDAAMPAAGQGAIVMMHDGGGDRSETVAALDQLLSRLGPAGYQFPTVSAGLGLGAVPPASTGAQVRGYALRLAQRLGGWLVSAMTAAMVVALVLSVIRLAVQVGSAMIHVRRVRRHRRRRVFLGPVTVIVPAFNEQANVAATVRSLVASDYPQVSVVVVDDGSSDDTAGVVARMGLRNVRLIRQENGGKPAALNTGIAAARTDFLVLVDGDTVLAPDAIGWLLQPFTDPAVGAVSGNAKVANRDGLLGRWQHLEYVMGFNLDRRMFEVGRCMPTIPGAIGAFRRRVLADGGGVPADTLAEDTDLTMSVVRAGWEVVYAEDAIAWTEVPRSLRQLWQQRYRWCFGTLQAIWKHRRALLERGPSGRLGRRGLGYLLVFQLLLPLLAPAVDVYAVYGLAFLPLRQVVAVWSAFVVAQALAAAYALRLDRESWTSLWVLPLQQFVYRQLMYLVVVQSAVTALTGIRLKWHRIARLGDARTQPASTG